MRLETLSREDLHTRGPRGGRAASEGIEAKRAKIYKIFIPALLVCALGFSCRRAAAYAQEKRYGCGLSADARRLVCRYACAHLGPAPAEQDVVSFMYGLAGLLAVALFAYLLFALLKAERF